MAYYAEIDADNKVLQTLKVKGPIYIRIARGGEKKILSILYATLPVSVFVN